MDFQLHTGIEMMKKTHNIPYIFM